MLIADKKESFFWKFVEYTFYLFIILFPFVKFNTFLFGGSSTRAVSLILLAIILGIVFGFYLFKKDNSLLIPRSPIFVSILLYFIFLTISGSVGMNFQTSFWSVATRTTGIWYLINLGFVIYVLWVLVRNNRIRQNKIILAVIFSSALFSFMYFLSPEGVNLMFQDYKAEAFTFGNTTFAAMYIFGAFLLSLYYLFQSEKKKWWMYVLPIVIVINPSIINSKIWFGDFSNGFLGQARASSYVVLFSLAFLFIIWLVSKIRDKKVRSVTVYSIFGLSIVAIIISAFSLLSHNGYLRKVYLNQATAVRPLVWEMSEKAIAERSYLGWGTDNFERVFEKNYDNRILQDEYGNEAWLDRAHNVFIDQL
ncbi:MAG: O-antigen ligase family protein, partial [bacterium]|nr:O-antigen ligase family protein [bacterium]